jgi:hypothetical protein
VREASGLSPNQVYFPPHTAFWTGSIRGMGIAPFVGKRSLPFCQTPSVPLDASTKPDASSVVGACRPCPYFNFQDKSLCTTLWEE